MALIPGTLRPSPPELEGDTWISDWVLEPGEEEEEEAVSDSELESNCEMLTMTSSVLAGSAMALLNCCDCFLNAGGAGIFTLDLDLRQTLALRH